MYVVIIAWIYVVLLMAVAEALSSQGTVLGAFFTLLLYGLLPLSIVVYILGTPGRKRARVRREAESADRPAGDGDGSGHVAVGAVGPVAPERKEA